MIGKCKICDMVFIANNEHKYKNIVSRHILKNHRDRPIDEQIVKLISEENNV